VSTSATSRADQIHTSVPMVDMIVSANSAREEIGVALSR
jgi:hypothetical protein